MANDDRRPSPAAAVLPLPLHLPLRQDQTDRSTIVDARGIFVATTNLSAKEFRLERAAFIVRAANSFQGMVEALEELLAPYPLHEDEAIAKARAALKAAKE